MNKVDAILSHKYASVTLPAESSYSLFRNYSIEIDLISNLDIRDIDNLCGGIFVSTYPTNPGTGANTVYGWGVTPFVKYMYDGSSALHSYFVPGIRYDPQGRVSLVPGFTSCTWTIGNLHGEIGPAGGVVGKTETAQDTYHQLFISNTNISVGYIRIWKAPDNSSSYGYPHINIPSDAGYDGSGTAINITTTDGVTTKTDNASAYFIGGVQQTFNFSDFTSYIPSKLSFKIGYDKYYGENGIIKCISGVSAGASVGTFDENSMTFSPLPLKNGNASINICITPNNKVYITRKQGDNSFGDFNLTKGTEYTLKISNDGIYINDTQLSSLETLWPGSRYDNFRIGTDQTPPDWGGGEAQGIDSDIIKEIRIIEYREDLGIDIITKYYPCEDGVMKEPDDYYTNSSSVHIPDSSFKVVPINKIPCSVRMRTQNGIQKFSKLIIKSDTNIITNGSGFVQYKK